MTDSKVYLIKGWKIEGSELVNELLNKLDEVSEDYYGEFEDYLIIDCVSGDMHTLVQFLVHYIVMRTVQMMLKLQKNL